ncbi:MAG: Omp28-related outer membrane protein [Bacteroidota bacterium]
MKRILPFILMLAFFSCSEQTPEIPCLSCEQETGGPDDPQLKKVLIEEFTGVHRVNCPAGSVEIEGLLDFYGSGLIAVSIHAGFFSDPYPESQFNFQTDEGEALNNFLDFPQGYPTAVINRKLFSSEDDLQLDRSSWGGYVAQELDLETEVNLTLALSYDSATRELRATTTINPLVDQSDEVRISVMLTETDIADVQLTPDGEQADYLHKHVLRDMLTPFDGEMINEAFVAGASIEKTHSIVLKDEWVANKMDVVVFVHKAGSSREILQAELSHLPE